MSISPAGSSVWRLTHDQPQQGSRRMTGVGGQGVSENQVTVDRGTQSMPFLITKVL